MKQIAFKIIIILLISGAALFFCLDSLIAQPPPPPPPPPSVPPPPPPPPAVSTSIVDTKHNLSISGPGTIKSATEEEICIFCHAPHHARRDTPYLWNRYDTTASYTPYQSSTLIATVGQPSGASKMCLSCHDGTIALGALVSKTAEVPFVGGIRFIPEGASKLGTDLSDDHPVSFVYDSALAGASGELAFPAALPPEVKLDSSGLLQCTSCHDPHNNINRQFLVVQNINSSLCTICHQKQGWMLSSHAVSNALWNGTGADPWPHTSYATVAENGCENCHKPHTAGKHERLLNYTFEEDNCIVCHNGNVAATNIETELAKPFKHAVQNYPDIHNPRENFTLTVQKHVECEDCHNPHQTNSTPSPGAPQVSGMTTGVTGINSAGQQIVNAPNQFEICYKCHADNNVLTTFYVDRQLVQLNTRLEFSQLNPSYHPVESQGINPNVPSLLPPYTTASIIFCTDCHGNDNTIGPRGPHGSSYKYLLGSNYTTLDNTQENPYNYALCYKCHDRTSILSDQSFIHNKHVAVENAPCSVCHDAHGISSTQGNAINNTHLINFDTTVVTPDSLGRLMFEDTGTYSGRCYLTCHGALHEPKAY